MLQLVEQAGLLFKNLFFKYILFRDLEIIIIIKKSQKTFWFTFRWLAQFSYCTSTTNHIRCFLPGRVCIMNNSFSISADADFWGNRNGSGSLEEICTRFPSQQRFYERSEVPMHKAAVLIASQSQLPLCWKGQLRTSLPGSLVAMLGDLLLNFVYVTLLYSAGVSQHLRLHRDLGEV